jgi:hypothetical protein
MAAGFFVSEPRTSFERALGATTLPDIGEIDPQRFLPSSRSVAFRRAAWAAVGGYPEWLDYCEDLVFDQELYRRGKLLAWTPHARVAFRPRPNLLAFFRQYFRYARGDGKADLWRKRHAIRYATYLVGLSLVWKARGNPVALAISVAAGASYLRRPVLRLWGSRERLYGSPCPRGIPTPRSVYVMLLGDLAWIPLIRLTGDVAKMLGYPCGVVWRLRRGRSIH